MRTANGSARRPSLATCATLLVALVSAAGCASSAPPAIPPSTLRTARVELVNLCDCDWRVILATPTGSDERTVSLPARATARFEVAGGDYTITQTALSGLAGPEATRRFPAHLEAGEAYRWRLATLFAATAAAP